MERTFKNNAPGAKALLVQGKPVRIEPGKKHKAEFDQLDKKTLAALAEEGCKFEPRMPPPTTAKPSSKAPETTT